MTRRGAARHSSSMRRHDGSFGRSEAGPLDVGRVAEQREHAFAAIARESVQVKRRAIDGSLIDLEVAGVNDDAHRRTHGERDAIDGAVCDIDEFDFVRADFDESPG